MYKMKKGNLLYDSVKETAIKKQGCNYISYIKKDHNKEVNVQGAPSSVIRWSTEVIL